MKRLNSLKNNKKHFQQAIKTNYTKRKQIKRKTELGYQNHRRQQDYKK